MGLIKNPADAGSPAAGQRRSAYQRAADRGSAGPARTTSSRSSAWEQRFAATIKLFLRRKIQTPGGALQQPDPALLLQLLQCFGHRRSVDLQIFRRLGKAAGIDDFNKILIFSNRFICMMARLPPLHQFTLLLI